MIANEHRAICLISAAHIDPFFQHRFLLLSACYSGHFVAKRRGGQRLFRQNDPLRCVPCKNKTFVDIEKVRTRSLLCVCSCARHVSLFSATTNMYICALLLSIVVLYVTSTEHAVCGILSCSVCAQGVSSRDVIRVCLFRAASFFFLLPPAWRTVKSCET